MSFSKRPAAVPALWALEDLGGASAASVHLASPGEDSSAVDIEAIERDAYGRGYQEGQLAGVQAEAARVRAALSALDDALMRLQGEADAWVANARENVCALAIAVARQVLQHEVATDATAVSSLAMRALTEIPVDQPVVVRLHPDDLALLEQLAPGAHSSADGRQGERAQVQWVGDPQIARGGCLLEGRDRIIDGRIDTALERLYRQLSDTDA